MGAEGDYLWDSFKGWVRLWGLMGTSCEAVLTGRVRLWGLRGTICDAVLWGGVETMGAEWACGGGDSFKGAVEPMEAEGKYLRGSFMGKGETMRAEWDYLGWQFQGRE